MVWITEGGKHKAVGAVNTTYFKGDRAAYTGNVMQLHGGTFYEVQMLEGHMVGQLKLVVTKPEGTN